MSMVDYALQLAGRGIRVLPLHDVTSGQCSCWKGAKCGKSSGKHPRHDETGLEHAIATTDPATIEAWWAEWPDANIGIVTGHGLMVADVDGPRGEATLARVLIELGLAEPETLEARSGRLEGGRHLYFRVPVDQRVANSSAQGIELRGDGGLIVAPPSLHLSGRRYEWVKPLRMVAPISQTLLAALGGLKREGRKRKAKVSAAKVPDYLRAGALPRLADRAAAGMVEDVPDEDIRAAAAALPNPELEWADWNDRLMALWVASKGSAVGLEGAHTFSHKCPKYNAETVEERWKHYPHSPPTELGFGSVIFWIREAVPGWMQPSREPKMVQDKELEAPAEVKPQPNDFFNPETDKANGHASLSQLFKEIDLDKPGNPLIKLNEKFAVIGDLGGKCLIMSWVDSKVDRSVKVPSFQTPKCFAERFAHRYVMVKRDGKDGEVIEEAKQLGSYWFKWGSRRTFEGIDLVPDGERELPGKVLNLWQGFAVAPAAGSWALMRRHILDVLADGDRPSADYIARWAAWAVQNPGERAEAALVLKGGKGSGKGTFADAMRQIFGQHGLHIFNSKHLVGAFNGHLRNCLFLFADEAFWAGDKHGEAVLKGMLTERVQMIEQKGIDATAWKNRLHVIMAANAEWVVPASHDERRYAVFEVSSKRTDDEAYFAALHAEMKNGGLAAMLHDLLALDLKGWHPRKIVRSAALAEQKARSLDPRHEWWESVLQSGVLPGRPDATHGAIPAINVYDRARSDVPKLKDASVTALGRFLRGFGAEGLHRENGNYWRFPNLIEARRLWTIKFGEWSWRNSLADWH